jgi:homocysteine S-methyltransferase
MAKYRHALPQRGGDLFLTDGGIETTLIFHYGLQLPHFAAFDLFRSQAGEEALRRYFRTYAALAHKHQTGLVLETATWRASSDWAHKLNCSSAELAQINRRSVTLLEEIRAEYESPSTPIVISGCVGPRGDGYVPGERMSAGDAQRYHAVQVETLANAEVDSMAAITMNYVEEALGIVRASNAAGVPVVISFTVEVDGRLPTGQSLGDAISQVDDVTSAYPLYYMINCAHTSHFSGALDDDKPWRQRIRGLRANASSMSHAQLNEAPELDAGDPQALGQDYAALRREKLRNLNVIGGCCGTDDRHVEQMAIACLPLFRGAP